MLLLLLGASLLTGLPVVADTPQSQLGKIEFPTSGSAHAQRHFLRGVLALHSFWYEEALTAFQESTKADPDFMMGYWGEAMAHNHPIWEEQDAQAARKALEQIREGVKITPRERAYLNAVKLLYGEGDKLARDRAYAAAMEQLYRDNPEDLEAASYYALSLLGSVRPSDRDPPVRPRLPTPDSGRRDRIGRVPQEPRPPRRRALYNPRVRRPDACHSGATGRAALCGNRP